MFRFALLRPWGPSVWKTYFRTLYPTRRDADCKAHLGEIAANLRKPGHWDAFYKTTQTSHAPAEVRLDEVHAPTMVIMGGKDPDFPDPEAEARWIADRLNGELLMVPDAGHYPQAEFPELVFCVRLPAVGCSSAKTRRPWAPGLTAGLSLDASVRVEADDRLGLERLLRYCARPAFLSDCAKSIPSTWSMRASSRARAASA